MLSTFQSKDFKVRLFIGFFLGMIALAMVITLVPGPVGSVSEGRDAIAVVDGVEIGVAHVQRRLARLSQRQSIPPALQEIYSRQITDQLIFALALEAEARRQGIHVTDEELADRIKRIFPAVFAGNAFLGRERYELEVQTRAGMTVAEFEEELRRSLLEDKFLRLATDGYRSTPLEIEAEFRKRNEKVKLDYVLVNPEEMQSRVAVSPADLAAYFERNKSQYQVPEKRSIRFALLDLVQLGLRSAPTEEDLRAQYTAQLDRFSVQNRAKVSHILFKIVGKSDAEIAEVRKKAGEVLAKLRKGAKFEDLARLNSEDDTKDKGGDLGWIVPRQTVPEFEQAAFSLPLGRVSDLVKTEYGFHILKVAERENARTRPFEEVRASLIAEVATAKAGRLAEEMTDKLTDTIRQSPKMPLEDLARQFSLPISETPLVAPGEMVGNLGAAQELHDEISRLKKGDLSLPLRLTRGAVVLAIKDIVPAHQGLLDEVRPRVEENFRREQGGLLARSRAEELSSRTTSGEELGSVAKTLGLEVKSSEAFALNGAVSGVGSGRDFTPAFGSSVGAASSPSQIGANWVVYRVTSREEAKPEDLEKQKKDLDGEVLRNKIGLAYAEFRTALQLRMVGEGRLTVNEVNYRRLTNSVWSPRK